MPWCDWMKEKKIDQNMINLLAINSDPSFTIDCDKSPRDGIWGFEKT